jgi:hypothetical protein
MSFATIFHAKIIELNATTWYASSWKHTKV